MTIAKAITLVGAGTNSTVITLTGNNTITKDAGGVTRITGFHFQKDGGGNSSKGFIVDGSWQSAKPVIFQTNSFTISATGLFLLDVPGGVIFSHCRFVGGWDDSFLQLKASAGQNSWTTADPFGSRDTNGELNHYIEACDFYGGTNQGIDADENTRVVYRYNTLMYSSFNTHGYDTSPASVRHFEVYENEFNHDGGSGDIANQNWAIWIRGGTGFIFNNYIANMAGGTWGDKPELKLSIRGAEDNRPQGACGNVSYPVPQQLGQSHNGTSYTTDPIRWYGNTGTLSVEADWNWDNPCGFDFSTFWQQNRDYVIGTAKSGYVAYEYPHPLASGSSEEEPTNTAPTAAAAATPTSGTAPLTVAFSSTGSSDPEGTTLTYSWAFGDSTNSTSANPSHTYAVGSYSAQLTVSDGTNSTASSVLSITANAPAEPSTNRTARATSARVGTITFR